MKTAMLIMALLLAGCSASPAPPAGLAKSDEISRTAVGFSQCMRDHGHQIADPTFNDDGLPVFNEPDDDRKDPTYQTDRQQCRGPLNDAMVAAGVPNQKGTPEQWLAFARCMREHGVDMADPTPDNRFSIDKNAYDSPAWQPAAEACGPLLPPAMREILKPPSGKGGPGK
jgi:hypothetical protein